MPDSKPIKKKRRRAKPQPVSLTIEELLALLTAAKAESTRDWLLLLTGYWHGLRVSEILGLRQNDVKDGYLTVQRLKGSLKTRQKLRTHEDPLLNEAAAIPSYIRNLRQWDKLFPINRRMADRLIKHYGKIAKIPAHKLHMHVLKHSCGQHWIDRLGLEHTRQLLGHTAVSSTQRYGRVTDEQADEALRKAVTKS